MTFLHRVALFLCMTCCLSHVLSANDVDRDLQVIRQTFEVKYAPSEWKKDLFGWNLEEEFSRLTDGTYSSQKDLQRKIVDFFCSFRDLHATVRFYSSELACLPFSIEEAEGRYFVSWVSKKWASSSSLNIETGDEILEFGGVPISVAHQDLLDTYYRSSEHATDRAVALVDLTLRLGKKGHLVPKGKLKLKLAGKRPYSPRWIYLPEQVKPPLQRGQRRGQFLEKGAKTPHPFFEKEMVYPHFETEKEGWERVASVLEANFLPEKNPSKIGSPKTAIPSLGRVVWKGEEKALFQSYIFEGPQKKQVGFLRIPNYAAGEKEAFAFEKLIRRMEDETDALIIDQRNNPGGRVLYVYALASMLSDRPLVVPTHAETVTQEDLFFAIVELPKLKNVKNDREAVALLGKTRFGYPVSLRCIEQLVDFCEHLLYEWKEGRQLTRQFPVFGIDQIEPHPRVCYTKPIVFLVNERSISAGDLLPAILQDNQRAIIVGSTTSGAGGYVQAYQFPNLQGIESFRCTGSIAERINGEKIENLGVSPDIFLEVTADDLRNGYTDFSSRLLELLEQL